MTSDDEFFNKLVKTFNVELEEKLQIIADGLLALERSDLDEAQYAQIVEQVFRAAHNIKGAARGVGIAPIGDIAHSIESLFSAARDKSHAISSELVSLCLLAVDGMHSVMAAFSEKKPLDFNIDDLLAKLQQGLVGKQEPALPLYTESGSRIQPVYDTSENESIRVSLHQIDRISALLEDLQANKIAIEDHYAQLNPLAMKTIPGLDAFYSNQESASLLRKRYKEMMFSVNELSNILNALQEEVRMLRLIPASGLLRGIARSMRDLALELGKKIELEVYGDNIKMDKLVLEGLKDPLIHLVRNAIDHGIESEDIRKKNNKSETGHIYIELIDEGDEICLNVRDDGAGIDCQTVAATAQKKNIVASTELEKMNEQDILNLIFCAGFSTKEIITDISGRGVGLDVVKTNLAQIKGDVSVTTQLGKYTAFHLRVPLTLASDRGLILVSGGQPFVLPISTVKHVMMLHKNEILAVESSEVVLFNGEPIPLRTLAYLLKLEAQDLASEHLLPVVILSKGNNMVALLVEKIIGEREIVIKPLSAPLVDVPCVAGATLAGNGQVMIVLNGNDILHVALHSNIKNRIASALPASNSETQPRILLVDDSITTRTLEKNILENNHYQVTVAVDGKEAWDLLLKEPYSLLITDIEMPNMNGIELTRRVKEHDTLHELPVIIVTSLGSDAQKKQGIDAGANAYIVKHHFESKELLDIVAQLI